MLMIPKTVFRMAAFGLAALGLWGCAENKIADGPLKDSPVEANRLQGESYQTDMFQPPGYPVEIQVVVTLLPSDMTYEIRLLGFLLETGTYTESGSTVTLDPAECSELTGPPPAVPIDCPAAYEAEKTETVIMMDWRLLPGLTLNLVE